MSENKAPKTGASELAENGTTAQVSILKSVGRIGTTNR